jgi:NAD(P)-dependent dehydrogenase (short-subunit alcohol dehydrogenase family)
MEQKIALVTGGNRGIGWQTALELSRAGVKVVIGARNEEQGKTATAKLRAAGADVDWIRLEVTNEADREAAREYFAARYGRLDILVNNAGVAAGEFPAVGPEHTASEVSEETLRSVMETNFFAVVALTQKLLPLLKASEAGRIVNLSSILGSLDRQADPKSPFYRAKSFAYSVSKTALNSLTVHLAFDLRRTAIKVNSAHPGWVKTDMGGKDAQMELEDGAKTSVMLALLPDDGPTGGFFHMGQTLPW